MRPRSQPIVAMASTCFLLIVALFSAQGQQLQPDPERAFAFGDVNLDGKLSREEFRDLVKNAPRLKNAPARKTPLGGGMLETVFDRLDQNDDGFLTITEYRRITQFRPGGGMGPFAKGGFARKNDPFGPRPRTEAKPKPVTTATLPDRPITAEQTRFFESKIRPVLMTKCAQCHSSKSEKVKGGLLVDSREGLRKGGDNGPAVVPGNLDESLLITAIRYEDDSLQMPPKVKLDDAVIADFEAWVKIGAPDPRKTSAVTTSAVSARGAGAEKARQFWSFQPPRASTPPKVKDSSWARSDIDRFLLGALESKGLKPVGDADRATWLRRVTIDLIGLPPTPSEVEAFLAEASTDAQARVVDRLLSSPRFGERWGRHWLDLARYAESSGKANMLYPNAWRYRDWVVDAFNDDMPFDRFLTAQIAGDLLSVADPRQHAQSLIATGFLAIGSKTHNTMNRQQFTLDLADEQIDVTSQTFLGLTIACARCHDHKFDPISQRDYYALSGVFQSTQTCYGTLPGVIQNINPSPLIELPEEAHEPSPVPRLAPARLAALEKQVAELVKVRDALTPEENFAPKGIQTRTRLAMLRFRAASFRPDGTPRSYAMGVQERFEPVDSPLYTRGELEHPGETVPRGLVQFLAQRHSPTITHGSGRLELARWLASSDNPLTARVMVNRVWLHLFGRGLVPTPDNFGMAGQPPSHPELLDTLAVDFMKHGWSVKALIRSITLSHAYQLASTHDSRNFEVDPDNTLVWRMSKKRIEAEAMRDAVLAVSGKLELEQPLGSPVALAGEGIMGPFRNFTQDILLDRHRSVFLPVVRDQLPEALALFDFADPSLVTGERSTTNGPTQALYLMNSGFILRQAEAAADLIREAGSTDDARIQAAYLRFLARKPTASETARARSFLEEFVQVGPGKTREDHADAAWSAFCQALYASAEFRYLD